ncbi:MAG: peptidylprolyl isomerase [Rhodocyclaceae bacterium]|jgi:peptidyl-prolyl cis-trans isomerase C|nr:peptidylprolyl isomerase [Rhodocyclaceae bacterium]
MKRSLQLTLPIVIASSLFSAGVLAQDTASKPAKSGGVVVTVNGKEVPKNRADALMAGQEAQGRGDSEELRAAVREELTRREILSQEAVKKGFDKKSDIHGQMELARQGVLIGAYLNDYARRNPVSDEQIRQEYNRIKSQMGDKEYKVRHVLVETEAEATAIIAKLKKGEKFDELAKQSKDPGSKDRGGDLGWANRAAYVKPFSDAMVTLGKGKFTETPVKSDFGYHVIQLDDQRDLKMPEFDEAKGQIGQRIQQAMVQKHIEELRAKAKVE